ncbi:EAL domain-containing protein [Sphingomonas sp. MMS24-J13]|uniref:EAL domain-containing protein n=1 Tax=Sphingomonas sp. MMS24-J13 TaxID=3238686 RepID=UPI00384B0D40
MVTTNRGIDNGHRHERPWRGLIVAMVFALAVIAVLAPVLAALLLARQQSFASERRKSQWIAKEIIRRADRTNTQLLSAHTLLRAIPAPPCSPEAIRQTAGVMLRFEMLHGAGFMRGNTLLCMMVGPNEPPIDLGPPNFDGGHGSKVRTDVRLPSAPGTRLISFTGPSGYTMFAHPDLTLDLALPAGGMTVGVMGIGTGRVYNVKGPLDRAALGPFLRDRLTSYIYGDRLVSIEPSNQGDYAGFVLRPLNGMTPDFRYYAIMLLPLAIVCAGLLIVLLRLVVRSEMSFRTVIRRALRANQFYLEYQPLVALDTGRWIGAEVLVRWRRGGEDVRPDSFIPYMEETGLIGALTDHIFARLADEAGEDLRRRPDFYLSVNVASADLQAGRLLHLIDKLLKETGCSPRQFIVEATERSLIDVQGGASTLDAARVRGLRVALDDFGTGYSSLSYLQQFPLDYIKIDKSFVDSAHKGAATSRVVSHIIAMARDLGLELVAEGVETAEQAEFLRREGVRYAQGWLFARSMSWTALIAGLSQQAALAE